MSKSHVSVAAKLESDVRARTAAWMSDDTLARNKGNAPEQVEARKRVARLFCELHLPEEAVPARDARLAGIDYALPVATTNARGIDVNNPKAGFLGMGRKPTYILSAKYPPKTDQDPLYALSCFPLKK